MDVTPVDDPESADAGALDLTPRGHTPRPRSSGPAKVVPILIGVLVVGAIGVLLATQLAGATTYFYNVDDAVERRAEVGDKRIRLQGNVIKGSVDQTGVGLRFVIAYNGVTVPVSHRGDVPDLFGPSIPIVIEGRFVGDTFRSDRVLVKHDETYDEANDDRIKDAERDAERNAATTIAP